MLAHHAFAVFTHRCTDEGMLDEAVLESFPQQGVGTEEVLQHLIVADLPITEVGGVGAR